MTPRGPLAPRIYWRRRLFVLGTVLALVLFVVNLVRDDDPAPAGEAATNVAAEPSSESPLGQTDGPRAGGKKGKKDKGKKGKKDDETAEPPAETPPPDPVPAAPTGPCESSDVSVTPSVPGAVAGQPVTITLTLQTETAEACTWRVSRETVAVKVTNGADPIWQSVECPRQLPSADVVVRRELTTTVAVTWNARYTSAGCPTRPQWAEPGEYYVQASALGGEPSPVVGFDLLDGSQVAVPDGPIGPEVPGADRPDDDRGKKKDRQQDRKKNRHRQAR